VQTNVPAYFKQQTATIISYTYTSTIASKMFNHRKTLRQLNIDDHRLTPPVCSCSSSPFNYNPIGHIITGDLAIVTNDKLRKTFRKGPKYREPQPINWNPNFKILMDSIEDYARKWAKQEEVELDTLSDWVTYIRSFIRKRIFKLNRSASSKVRSIFNDKGIVDNLTDLQNK